ncbi:hypothetical protein [Pseudomonas sp. PS01301]|uniref:hypothetical protein n=1 Tax=Pseudomonas sp. PS01301 TaxID=2991437 RepID=UPI00249BBAC1|nr:hypothetical protein [Pseudomonas sp. PS01301]
MKKAITPAYVCPALLLVIIAGLGIALLVASSGTQPFKVRNIGIENAGGAPQMQFSAGELVGIRREVCTQSDTAIEFFPSLRRTAGGLVALPQGAVFMNQGCRETVYLFSLPSNLPPGKYEYDNLVKYQSNLIGRDEQTVYPPLELEVVAHAE